MHGNNTLFYTMKNSLIFSIIVLSLAMFAYTMVIKPKPNANLEDSAFYDHFSDITEDTTLVYQDYKAKKVKYLIVHCIASNPKKKRWTPDMLKTFFTSPVSKGGRGWNRYGYNEYLDYEGNIHELTPIDCDEFVSYSELTNNAAGYNSTSVAISLEGGVETINGKLKSVDNFSEIQKKELIRRLQHYKDRWPWIKIIGHNEVSAKDCPVINLKEILKQVQ